MAAPNMTTGERAQTFADYAIAVADLAGELLRHHDAYCRLIETSDKAPWHVSERLEKALTRFRVAQKMTDQHLGERSE